jgi:predicted DNA-binding protein
MQIRHNITLDEDVSKELDTIAQELGEKKSKIIEKALTVYFDLLDLKLAKKRMKELEEGRDKLIDAEEVWKDLGI